MSVAGLPIQTCVFEVPGWEDAPLAAVPASSGAEEECVYRVHLPAVYRPAGAAEAALRLLAPEEQGDGLAEGTRAHGSGRAPSLFSVV